MAQSENNSFLRAPTIKDVAKKSGVSLGTASNALSGKAFVQKGTLERVKQVALELGYQKNHSAELLVSNKSRSRPSTGNIGLAFLEMDESWSVNPLVSAYLYGVDTACRKAGKHLLVEYLGGDKEIPRCVLERKVDGLIAKLIRPAPHFFEKMPNGFPVVAITPFDFGLSVPQVGAHDEASGTAVTQYLWDKGHRRIGFISPDSSHPMFLRRYRGYEFFLKQKDVFDSAMVWTSTLKEKNLKPELEPPNLDREVREMMALEKKPTALVVANDWTAAGLYRSLKMAGLSIPEELSVIGFDNSVELCSTLMPSLTSFQIPFVRVAARACELLLAQIESLEKNNPPSLELIYGSLVERHSVKDLSK
jgi:LacI family transcriptional regulator